MPRVKVISRNFMEMVAGLPPAKLDLLYKRHWTCQAVLRSLPPLAKLYVMRLLYVEEAVPSKSLQDWALPDAQQKHQVAINRMEKLRVILVERKKEVCYRMNPVMQKQLLQALSIGKGPPRDVMPGNVAVRLPTPAELDTYAMKQWESVLLQLVSSASSEAPIVSPNFFVIDMFKLAGLLLSLKPNSAPSITDTGFQFLLMDTNSQLWQLVQVYVSAAEDRGTDSGELIGFLLELGFHTVGEAYSVGALTTPLQKVLEELAALGLVQLQKGMKEQWYIPTKLASNLSASLSESSDMQSSEVLGTQGCIVVETNFRVYAYTASKLQTEILRRFARLEYQLPNLVVGALNKESINTAFSSGISAEQIITYLSKHAHPHVAKRMPVVPETVSDQIRLWESDRNRVELLPAYFYDDFPSTEVYETVLNHARSIGGLLWEDASNRRLVVREELHGDMRLFIRRQSGAAGQIQADLDYDVVRHHFPRSSTDAMITWFVTKLGFAMLWPNTVLPSIEQPLGGELLVTRRAAEVLLADPRVCSQSDWGIDTLYTFVIAQTGLRMAEVYIPEGKVHALYGGLRDLRTMLVECFSAIQSLKNEVVGSDAGGYCIEFAKAVPELVQQKVGYDIEKSLKLLRSHWTPRQQELLHQHFDSALVKGLLNARDWPCWGFADEEAWTGAYLKFLDHFEKGDDDWEELLFKVWVARVLNHTLRHVIRGYDVALGSLRDFVWETRQRFGMELKATAAALDPIVIAGHTAAEGLAVNAALSKSGRNKAQWLDMDNLCTV